MKRMRCGIDWKAALATMALCAALAAGPALAHGDADDPQPQEPPCPAVDTPPDECPDPMPGGMSGGAARLIVAGVTLGVRVAAL